VSWSDSIPREHHGARNSKKRVGKKTRIKFYVLTETLFGGNLGRRDTDAVDVAVEKNVLAFALGALGGLNPLAGASAGPEGLEEASPAGVSLAAVVWSHDLLDGLAGLISVVEGDGADIVVKNVGLDDAVEDVATDEAEVTVNCSSCSTSEIPGLRLVVGEGGVGVLKESDGNYICKSAKTCSMPQERWTRGAYRASGLPRGKECRTRQGG
jgi:hypothetical protein